MVPGGLNQSVVHACVCAQVLVVAGGIGVGHKLRKMVREAQAVQTQLTKVCHVCVKARVCVLVGLSVQATVYGP